MTAPNRNRYYPRTQQKKSGHGFVYLRLMICAGIIAAAFILKYTNSPMLDKISRRVNEEMQVSEAVEAVSRAAKLDEGISAVFGTKEKETAQSDTAVFGNDYYIGEQGKEIEEEIKKELEKNAEEEKRLSAEALSFQMTNEELSDDTKAEVFRIPPPSYCSYEKKTLGFKYATPLRGVITSKFGYRDHPIITDASFHTGLDIAAKKGTAVGAFADGTVVETGRNSTYGNYVRISHAGGFYSFYGHNSKVIVKKGQKVKLGQKVCEVGSTGMSTGPHLHFEIRANNIRLDPALYISPSTI